MQQTLLLFLLLLLPLKICSQPASPTHNQAQSKNSLLRQPLTPVKQQHTIDTCTSNESKAEAIFNHYVQHITPYRDAPIETVLEQTAHFFLGTPYVAGTLDSGDENEQLVVNLHQMDCFTYVENVIALSKTALGDSLTFEGFKAHLQNIRYRDGALSDYASRLHYTSDWIYNNQEKGIVENISQQLSAVKETKAINFMSTHRSAYRQLAHNDTMLEKIKHTEQQINNREGYYYLPKQDITAMASHIPHMAVVGIATTIDGLDTTHIGFAYHKDGVLGFIHASSLKNEVVIDANTLSEYCMGQRRCRGIVVPRMVW